MSLKSELSEIEAKRWEDFKKSILIDKEKRTFNGSLDLGNCSVSVSFINNQLCFELFPNESADLGGEVDGIILNLDDENLHVSSIMSMAENAKKVKEAKLNRKATMKFN